jgi:predicted outer membrane repeat protein
MSQRREMRMLRMVLLVLVAVTFCALGHGRTIRVAQDGLADCASIQAAIDDANNGDAVLVAPGTYTGDGNRDIDFKGKAITVKSENGPGTCTIDCGGSMKEPHRGFYFHNAEDANSVVQGFTITRGCILRRDYSGGEPGGAVYCEGSSPRISDCIIRGNSAASGGGIACLSSDAILTNCIVTANATIAKMPPGMTRTYGSGGGILITGSHPMLVNCIITGNRAGYQGGAVLCEGSFTILNCTICSNHAGTDSNGGGIYISGRQSDVGILRNCILWANVGGGCDQIAGYSGGILGTTRLEITYCTIQGGDQANCLRRVDGSWSSTDPLFADPGHWDPNGTPDSPMDDFWVEGDYHLKSQAGRWDPISQDWVKDDVTSPCIDGGDPNSPIGDEPFPNGGRINMGAYAGTAEASKSPPGLHAPYGGGAGEPNDPYLIYTAEQFKAIGDNPDDWARHFTGEAANGTAGTWQIFEGRDYPRLRRQLPEQP